MYVHLDSSKAGVFILDGSRSQGAARGTDGLVGARLDMFAMTSTQTSGTTRAVADKVKRRGSWCSTGGRDVLR